MRHLITFGGFLQESMDNRRVLHYYAFDWDNNILDMPTKIMVETEDGREVGMSTADFAEHREKLGHVPFECDGDVIVGINYGTAFRNFRDADTGHNQFLEDVQEAVALGAFSSSWEDFIECLTNGSVFAIITARGHEPQSMQEGVEWIIDNLSDTDKKKMHDSLLMFLHLFREPRGQENSEVSTRRFSQSRLVQRYLGLCEFIGVSAPSRGAFPGSPEQAKVAALKDFVKDVNRYARSIGYTARVGFSDDDAANIKHMKDALTDDDIDHELLWPYVEEFIIKHTPKSGEIIRTNIPTRRGMMESKIALGFAEFLTLYESEGSLEIQRHEFNGTSWEYSWLLNGREVGEMMVFVEGENASIVSFFKHKGKATPRGCGYEFIKMCIEDLLESGFAVHQADHTSNANSQEVWRKLADEYEVETTTWRGDPAKVIRKK